MCSGLQAWPSTGRCERQNLQHMNGTPLASIGSNQVNNIEHAVRTFAFDLDNIGYSTRSLSATTPTDSAPHPALMIPISFFFSSMHEFIGFHTAFPYSRHSKARLWETQRSGTSSRLSTITVPQYAGGPWDSSTIHTTHRNRLPSHKQRLTCGYGSDG